MPTLEDKELDLLEQEGAAGDPLPEEQAELGSLDGEDDDFNFHSEKGAGKLNVRARVRSLLGSKSGRRRLLVGGVFGGSFLLVMVYIIFFISSLVIPNFMEHVVTYQFTRTARQFSQVSEQIHGEKIMLDTAKDGVGSAENGFFRGMMDRYKQTNNKVWDKINSYRPQKIVDNLETTSRLTYVYEDGVSVGGFTRQRLTALVLDGQEISASNPTFFGRLVHPIQTFRDKISYRSDLKNGLEKSLNGRHTIIRSKTAKEIRSRTNAKLIRWTRTGKAGDSKDPDNYKGDTKTADRLNAQESHAVATDNGRMVTIATSDEVMTAAKEAEGAVDEATEACLKDAGCLDEQIATGEPLSQRALTAMDAGLKADTLTTVTSVLSTVNAVAIPLCLIYDGSLVNSKNTIDAQTDANIRTFTTAAAVSDQQKAGDNVTSAALGAFVRQLHGRDGVGTSVSEIRANGGQVDTTQYASTQASASQSFSLFDAIPGIPAVVISFMNGVADNLCPTLTNTYVGLGLGAGEIIITIGSGGSVSLADQELKVFIRQSFKEFSEKILTKKFATNLVKTGAAIGGATLLAKLIVTSRAAGAHNGLGRGESFAADIDAGGNATANYLNQQMFHGAPMTNLDVALGALEDRHYLAQEQSKLPAMERYFALTNPDSLLAKFGTMVASFINVSALSKSLSGLRHILNPFSSFAAVFSHWGKGTALAAAEEDKTNYGQVQFGWTPAEDAYIANDASFQHPLENQHLLDTSGREAEIANKYHDCFEKTVGELLAQGKIQRDTNGNVLEDKGLCSPKNLSYLNNEFGTAMVFRWRVAMRHQKMLDHFLEIQNVQVANP